MQPKAVTFAAAAEKAGIPVIFTCTGRPFLQQTALFAQGRYELAFVNALRKQCGLYLLTPAENKSIVTWTLNSKHIIGVTRLKSEAFDTAIWDGKQATWNLKIDINKNKKIDYLELAKIGDSLGLNAGGLWKTPDYPHFQYRP